MGKHKTTYQAVLSLRNKKLLSIQLRLIFIPIYREDKNILKDNMDIHAAKHRLQEKLCGKDLVHK